MTRLALGLSEARSRVRSALATRPPLPPPVKVAFTWFALVGAVVVFVVAILFRTPPEALERAKRQAASAKFEEELPLALRS